MPSFVCKYCGAKVIISNNNQDSLAPEGRTECQQCKTTYEYDFNEGFNTLHYKIITIKGTQKC